MWEYQCPNCSVPLGYEPVEYCVKCGGKFKSEQARIPPRFLKSKEAISEYAHEVLAPKLSPEQRELLFKYFTVIFSDGFETGDFSAWTGTEVSGYGTATVATDQVHHGTYAGRFTVTETGFNWALAYKTFASSYATLFARAYVRLSALPTSGAGQEIVEFTDAHWANLIAGLGLGYDTQARWRIKYLKNGSMTTKLSGSPAINTWYCLELKVVISATVGEVSVWIDGNSISGLSDTGFDNNDYGNIDELFVGIDEWVSEAYPNTVWVDCVVVADTYIGPEVAVWKFTENLRVITDKPIRRVVSYRRRITNSALISDVFRRIVGFPRRLLQDLSSLSSIFRRRVAFLRRVRLDLSVIRDVFSFIFVPIVKIYRFIQSLYVLSDVPKRKVSYRRRKIQEVLVTSVFKRIVNYIRAFVFKVEWFADDFNDNVIDLTKWDTIQVNTGTVAEANQRLEVSGAAVAAWAISGLVSKKPYDLTQCGISVDVVEFDSLESMCLFVNLTKTTTSDPYAESNWYLIQKNRIDSTLRIRKRVGGVLQPYLYYAAWKGATGSLMIAISDGVISFYENGEFLVSEPYALPSYNAFIYIDQDSASPYSGTDAFDNFAAAITKKPFPPTLIVRDVFSWHPRLWIRQLIMNLSIIATKFRRRVSYKRPLIQNLSVITSVFRWRPRLWIRKLVENLSVIRDVFTSVYKPFIPVYRFILNLSVISDVPKRVASYTRKQVQILLISDVLRRFIGFPRRLIQDLSTLKDAFFRRVAYLRRLRQDLSVIRDVFSFIYIPVVKIYKFVQQVIIRTIFARRVGYKRKFITSTLVQDFFRRIVGLPRRLVENLSVLSVRFLRRVSYFRRLVQNLSVLRDVFSFIYVPIVKIYKFIQQVVIRDVFVRRASYIRRAVNATVISDVFKRIVGFPRRLTQNLSTLSIRFIRKATYLRRLVQNLSVLRDIFSFIRVPLVKVYRLIQSMIIQALFVRRAFYVRKIVNSTFIQDLFKRFVVFPRRLIQNLSVISLRFLRRVVYQRKLTQNTLIRDILRRVVGFPRKFIQNLSIIQDVFRKRVNYLRRLTQLTYIQARLTSVYTAFVRVYRLIQTMIISAVLRRRVTLTRRFIEDLSSIKDIFSFIYTKLVRVYRFVENLSTIGDAFRYQITYNIAAIRQKLAAVQEEIADLYERVKKKAEFLLTRR